MQRRKPDYLQALIALLGLLLGLGVFIGLERAVTPRTTGSRRWMS